MAEKAEQKEQPEAEDELHVFVIHDHFVTTIDEEKVRVPKVSWGKELKILALLKDIVKVVIESGVLGNAIGATDPEMIEAAKAQVRIQAAIEAGEEPDQQDLARIEAANQKMTKANMRTIALVAQDVLETGPDKLTEAVCVLLEKERDWVEAKLESEEMLGLVIPFLYAKRQRIAKVLGRYTMALTLQRKAA